MNTEDLLKNINWTPDEKVMIKSLINRLGSGQHPYCDEQSFDYFTITYLKEIFSSKSYINLKDKVFTEEGKKLIQQINNKLVKV